VLLDLVLGYECNLKCDYCTITDGMRRRNLTTARVRAAIDEGARRGITRVQFGGGEPTIRADLIELVAHARARGFDDVKVQTNGLMLSYDDHLASLVEAGVTRLAVSLHAHEADRYHRLVRRAGTFAHVERGLTNAVRRGIPVEAELIAKHDTYRQLPEAARWLAERGVRAVRLWLVSLTDGNEANVQSLPRMAEVAPFYKKVFDEARVDGRQAVSLHLPKCMLAGYEEHAVDPAAGGVWCVTPDAEFALEESSLGGHVKPERCRACVHDASCRGVRRDYAARFGTDELTPIS